VKHVARVIGRENFDQGDMMQEIGRETHGARNWAGNFQTTSIGRERHGTRNWVVNIWVGNTGRETHRGTIFFFRWLILGGKHMSWHIGQENFRQVISGGNSPL
jgi:hypothetical protein